VSTSTFTFVDVIDTEQNSRMKIDSVSYSTDAPVLGGELLVSVVGELGEMNATRDAYFTPACLPTWPSDIFEFAATEIAITGGPNTRVERDGLLLTGFTNESQNPFRTETIFRITNVTTTETFISPTQWSGKKQNYSHHSLTEYPVPPLQPVDNVTTLTKSAAPGLLPAAGGTVT